MKRAIARLLRRLAASGGGSGPSVRPTDTTAADVHDLYELFLDRKPECSLVVAEKTGRPWKEVVRDFLASDEYATRVRDMLREASVPPLDDRSVADERATVEDVHYSYRLLLQRNPDPEGYRAYRARVDHGISIRELVSYFVGCPEWIREGLYKSASKAKYKLVEARSFPIYVIDSDPVVGHELASTGEYEPHISACLQRRLREGDRFVDIGANIGYHTLLAANLVGPTGRVLAFEPSNENVKALVLNTRLSGLDNVDIYPFALSDAEGLLSLMKTVSIASTHPVTAEDPEYFDNVDLVYSARLDDVLAEADRVDMIKCDVDGHDFLAMRGAEGILKRFQPTLVLEFNPGTLRSFSGVEPVEYLRYVLRFGYELDALLRSGETVPCGAEPARVFQVLERGGWEQVDLLADARPGGLEPPAF